MADIKTPAPGDAKGSADSGQPSTSSQAARSASGDSGGDSSPGVAAVQAAIAAQPTMPGSTGSQAVGMAQMAAGLSTDQVQALYDAHHQTVAAAGGYQAYYHGAPPASTPDPYKYSRVGAPPLYYGPGNPNNERNADGSLTTLGQGRANDRGWNLPPGASPTGLGGRAEASPAGQGPGGSAQIDQINSELGRINKLSDAQRITALEGLAATYGGKLEVLDSSGKLVDAGSWLSEERDRVQEHADQVKANDSLFPSLQSDLAKVNALPPSQRSTALEGLAATYGGKLEVLDSSGKSVDAGTWLTGERNRVQVHADQVKAKDSLFSSLQSDLGKLDDLQPSQRVTALEGLATTYGGNLAVLDSSGKSVDAGTWLTGERDRVQRIVDDAILAEVDRVPDSQNAGLQVKSRREFRELTGRDKTGDPAKDQAILAQAIAADDQLEVFNQAPESNNAGLQVKSRREFRELTGQDMTGDPAKDQALANRVNAADAALNEVDRVPDSRTAGLPGPETSDQAVKVAPNSNRPLELVVANAQKVQRSGPGHPGFQDQGATQRITAETLKAGGTIYINGEPVDVAELVRQNTVYPDSDGTRGRGSSQRQATYDRTLQTLADKLQAGQAQGSVSTLPRPAPTGPALTWETLPTHGTLDGQRYSLDDIITANMTPADQTGVRGRSQREVGNVADRARVLAQINDLYQKGRFVPDGSDGRPAPYFNPDTRKGVNAGDLPDLVIPGAGFVTSIHDSRGQQSPGGPIVSPGESRVIATEAALAAAEVLTIPASGAVSVGVKRLANTVKNPAGNVALNRFRRETADLVASGLDPSTARQVAATNQGQTVADMARLEKGLTSPNVDPYAGLSTGQQTIDDAARAANNAAEVERKLTGSRETPETLARRLQNQQHATNQKTADTLLREIDNKAAANKVAFLRGQEIPYPEVDKAVYLKGVNNRSVATQTTGEPPTSRSTQSYVEQLRALDTATRNYNDRWRLPDPPSDGPSPTGWNPDSSGPEYGSRGNFWSAKGTRGDGGVATLERTSQQTALSADERARLLKNTAGRDEFVDIPDVAPPTLRDVTQAPQPRAPNVQPGKLVDVDGQTAPASRMVDSPRPTSTTKAIPAPAADAVAPKVTTVTAGGSAAVLVGPLPSTGTDKGLQLGAEPVTAGDTLTESEAKGQTFTEDQTDFSTRARSAPRSTEKTKAEDELVTRGDPRTTAINRTGQQVRVPGRFPLDTPVDTPLQVRMRERLELGQAQPVVTTGTGVSLRTEPVENISESPAEETLHTQSSTEHTKVTDDDTDAKTITELSPDGPPGLQRVRVPKLPPRVQINGRRRVQDNEVVLPAGEEHPHVVEHETKAVIRTDLRTGEQRVTPVDYRNVETLEVVKRGQESTDGRQVESGALTVTNRRGRVHAVSDPALTGKSTNAVIPRFPYTPPPPKPAKRRRGGGKKKNGSAGEDKANRGPTQISVEFGG